MIVLFYFLILCYYVTSAARLTSKQSAKQKANRKALRMAKRKGLSFYRRKKRIGTTVIREVITYIVGIAIAVFLALVLTYFLGMSTKVVGESMEPALYNGQTIYIDRFSYMLGNPKAGDVVVFLPNGNKNAHYYVKRVLAVPGDEITIRDGMCYVNGEKSSYVFEKIEDPGIAVNKLVLDVDAYFCMGDNSDNSEDSRSANIGPVKDSDILGRVWFHGSNEETGMGFVE